jgi:metal-responsive CopG/Arc/MetJ family transcriptional regulator
MRTLVDLPEEHIKVLKQLSEQSQLSRAELVRRAVAEYLQRHQLGAAENAFGIWRYEPRDGLDYQRGLREEWDS